jgi:hypothetical protein
MRLCVCLSKRLRVRLCVHLCMLATGFPTTARLEGSLQGTSQVLCLSTGFPCQVLSLSTKPEVPWFLKAYSVRDKVRSHHGSSWLIMAHHGDVNSVDAMLSLSLALSDPSPYSRASYGTCGAGHCT